ncbi:MAG: Poly-beta-1,6-N-acetyl-D-glucosamine synthase [Microgenomates bacterium OLB22]|nr:MAG: Poly-beta-1,6-N-acetyl-D-glucosamine synthase [Microgenomates bacterium OLB22]
MTVSLIIPCYNEEVNIQKGVLDRIGNYTASRDSFVEVIIVDDGSNDKSANMIAQKYLPKFTKLKLVRNKHQGKAIAVITGMKKSKRRLCHLPRYGSSYPSRGNTKIDKRI